MTPASVRARHQSRDQLDTGGLPRIFHIFWAGESVSLLGTSTSTVFVPLVAVVSLHATAGWMGLLTAFTWLPWVVIGLPAGAWVDRMQPRHVMIAADLVSAACAASVPLAWILDRLSLAQLIVVAFVNGTATVFFRAAYPRQVRQVTGTADPARAYGRLNGTESLMQLAGPGVAGALLTVIHAAVGLLLDAVSFLVSAFCLRRMPSVPPEPGERIPLRSSIAQGLRTLAHDRMLRFGTLMGGASNFGLTGYQTLLVLFLVDRVGMSGSHVGGLLALGAVGGVLGAWAAPQMSRRIGSARSLRVFQLLAAPTALLIPAAALVPTGVAAGFVVVGLIGVGLGVVAGNVVRGAFNQRYVPDQIRARLVTSSSVINYGTMPVAALTAGWLGTAYGLPWAMTVMVGIHAVACLSVLVGPYRSGRDLPTGQAQIR